MRTVIIMMLVTFIPLTAIAGGTCSFHGKISAEQWTQCAEYIEVHGAEMATAWFTWGVNRALGKWLPVEVSEIKRCKEDIFFKDRACSLWEVLSAPDSEIQFRIFVIAECEETPESLASVIEKILR